MILELGQESLVAPANGHIGAAACVELDFKDRDRSRRGCEFESGGVVPLLCWFCPLIGIVGPGNLLREENVLEGIGRRVVEEIGAIKGVRGENGKDDGDVVLDLALQIRHGGEGEAHTLGKLLRTRLSNNLRGNLASRFFDAFGANVERGILHARVVIPSSPTSSVSIGLGEELGADFLQARLKALGQIQWVPIGPIVGNLLCEAEPHLQHLPCIFCLEDWHLGTPCISAIPFNFSPSKNLCLVYK